MKISLLLSLFAICLLGLSCKAQIQKHAELKDLYRELLTVYKTENDSLLKAFSCELAPTLSTLNYMRKNFAIEVYHAKWMRKIWIYPL